MEKPIVTVFTPAYNRKETMERLYNSLKKQTNFSFEWIVIDDGSVDETDKLFDRILQEKNEFNIIYKKVENGGKHRAINKGIDIASGKLFFIVDSDDYVTNDAIEKIIAYDKTIKNHNEEKIAAVSGYRGYSIEEPIGEMNSFKYVDAFNYERKKYKLLGDKAEAYYLDVLKNNKFPEIEGEKFIAENVVWNAIAGQGYKVRWFTDIIVICLYQEDGLTAQGMDIYHRNPKGYLLNIKSEIKYYKPNFIRRLEYYYGYYKAVNKKEGYTYKKIANDLDTTIFNVRLSVIAKKIKDIIKGK